MFSVNDVVMYGSNGICRISSIEKRNLTGNMVEYLILCPVYNDNNTFYIPADNGEALKKLQKICTRKEVDNLIRHIKDEKTEWIENDNVRKEEYSRIINSGNRHEIIKLINTLYLRRKELAANKKRLRTFDESLFDIAEKMIFEEFAYVLGIDRDDVGKYIQEHIT